MHACTCGRTQRPVRMTEEDLLTAWEVISPHGESVAVNVSCSWAACPPVVDSLLPYPGPGDAEAQEGQRRNKGEGIV
eukprot:354234-Chlamydomonas_euryale.AAC.19